MSASEEVSPEEITPPPTPRYNLRNRTPHTQDRPGRPRTRASLAAIAAIPSSPTPSSSHTATRSAAAKGAATSSKQNRRTRTLPKRKARPSAPAGSSIGRRLFDNRQTSTPASSRAPSESLSAADYDRTFTNLYQWPKPQLIEECRKQNLLIRGTKTQLRERLAAHLAKNHTSYFESTEQIPKGATHDSTVQLQRERDEEQNEEQKDEIVDNSRLTHDEILPNKASLAKNEEDESKDAFDQNLETQEKRDDDDEKQDNEQIDSTPMKTRSGTLLDKTPLTKPKEQVLHSNIDAHLEQQIEKQEEEQPRQSEDGNETPMRTRSGAVLEKTPATKSKRKKAKKEGTKKKSAANRSKEEVIEKSKEITTDTHLRTERKLSESFEESEKKDDFASKQTNLEPQPELLKVETPSERIATTDPTKQEEAEKKITSDTKNDDMMIVDEEAKDSKPSVIEDDCKMDDNENDEDCTKHESKQTNVHTAATEAVQTSPAGASVAPSNQMKPYRSETSAPDAEFSLHKTVGEEIMKTVVASQSQQLLPSQDHMLVDKPEQMDTNSEEKTKELPSKLNVQESNKAEELKEKKTPMEVDAVTSVPVAKLKMNSEAPIPRAKFVINSAQLNYSVTDKGFTLVVKSTKKKAAANTTTSIEPESAAQEKDIYAGEIKPTSAEKAPAQEKVVTEKKQKSILERSNEDERIQSKQLDAEKEVTGDKHFSPFSRFQRKPIFNSVPRERHSSAPIQPISFSPKTSPVELQGSEHIQTSEEPETKNDPMKVDNEMPSPTALPETPKSDPRVTSTETPSASPVGQGVFQANVLPSPDVQITPMKVDSIEASPSNASPGSSIAKTEKVTPTGSTAQVALSDDVQTSKENPIHTPTQPDTPGSRSLTAMENRQETYIRLADNNVAFQFTSPSEEIPFSESPLPSPKLAIANTSIAAEERMETNFNAADNPNLNNDKDMEDAEMSISPNNNNEQATANAFDPQPPINENIAIDDNAGEPILGEEIEGQESDDNQRYLVSDADQERVETDRPVSMPEQHSSANADDADDTMRSADVEERSSEEERQSSIPIHAEIAESEHVQEGNMIHMNIESQGEAEDSLSSSDSRSLIDTPPSLANREIETEESPRSGESAEPAHSSGLSSIGDRPDDDVGNQVRVEDANADEVDQEDQSYAQVNEVGVPVASISADDSNMEASEHEGIEWQSPSSLLDDAEKSDHPIPATNSQRVEGFNTGNASLQVQRTQPEIGHSLTPQTSPRERRNVDRLRSTELVEPRPTTNEINVQPLAAPGNESRSQPSPPRKTLTNRFLSDDIYRLDEVTAQKPAKASLLPNPPILLRESEGALERQGPLHSSTGIFRSNFLGRSSQANQEITSPQNARAASEIDDEEKPVIKRYSFNRLSGDGQPPNKRQKVDDPSISEDRIAIGRGKRPADELLHASEARDSKRRRLSNQKMSFDMMPTPARTLHALLPSIAGIVSISDNRKKDVPFSKVNEHGSNKGSILARLEQIEAENAPKKFCAFGRLQGISSKPSKTANSPNKNRSLFNMGSTPARQRQAPRPTIRTNLGMDRKGSIWDAKALAEASVKKAKELALMYHERQFESSPSKFR